MRKIITLALMLTFTSSFSQVTTNQKTQLDTRVQPKIVDCLITQTTKQECKLYIVTTSIYARRDGDNVYELVYMSDKGVKNRDHFRPLCKAETLLAGIEKDKLMERQSTDGNN